MLPSSALRSLAQMRRGFYNPHLRHFGMDERDRVGLSGYRAASFSCPWRTHQTGNGTSVFDDARQIEKILDDLPEGVALTDGARNICWSNKRFGEFCCAESLNGQDFFDVLGQPALLGPEYSPFHKALVTSDPQTTKLRFADGRCCELSVSRARWTESSADHLIAVLRDVTHEVQQQQKLKALHQVGLQLADFTPEEVQELTVDERIELLKSNILHYAQDLLNYDVVEIRLIEQDGKTLAPLVAVGMADTAVARPLSVEREGSGVTGFVAATGQSYLCEDASDDPLFMEGFVGARSSITVPLMLHDHVIGTFNVESPEPRAFTEEDLLFIELFARDVALALNTLELLAAQSINAALESVEAIHRAVALPIDHILNEVVQLVELYAGSDEDVKMRLLSILRDARKIKGLIQNVGQQLTPADAVLAVPGGAERQRFQGVRVLVVDDDDEMRHDAHVKLEQYGCEVETAQNGQLAINLVRSRLRDAPYHMIISDVRLPDMTGHQLQVALKEFLDPVPLVLMQGFGYDPGHSIVKARQDGLHPKALLFKPFRLEQLLEVMETVLEYYGGP